MTHPLKTTADTLRREIAEAERSLDAALEGAATLTRSIVAARRACDVPAHTGQSALLRLQGAQSKLVQAQHDLFRVHDELFRIGRELMGPEEPYKPAYMPTGKSPETPAAAAPRRLRLASAA